MHSNKGLSIIEVIISVAILAIIAASSVTTILGSFSSNRLAQQEITARELLNQSLSALQSIASQDWSLLSSGTYGLTQNQNQWQLTPTPDLIDSRYTRTITLSPIYRNNNDQIDSSGILDPDSFQLQIDITWNFTPTRNNSVSSTTLLTNWQLSLGNQNPTPTPTPTTCNQFCLNQGYSSGTCRPNANQCTNNNETHQPSADSYCTTGAQADTCCCLP